MKKLRSLLRALLLTSIAAGVGPWTCEMAQAQFRPSAPPSGPLGWSPRPQNGFPRPPINRTNTALASAPQSNPAGPARTTRVLDEVGAHFRSWKIVPDTAPPRAQAGARTANPALHRLVEMASGMHYWTGTNWAPSEASFDVSQEGDAYIAAKVHGKVRLNSEINIAGAVTIVTSDNKPPIHETPVGIGLFDRVTGRFQLIGVVTNTAPELVQNNVAIYKDAFARPRCLRRHRV